MTDADETFRKHMQEEAAQKLAGWKSHLALSTAMGVVLPAEGDAFSIPSQNPMIRDGDAMSVAPK